QDALKYYKCRIEYRNKMDKEQTHSEIALSDANRSIREIEMQNDLMRQVNVMQNLQIKNGTIQTFIFELAFILLLLLILFVDTLARRNRKRKNELKVLNDRLQQEIYERIEAEGRLNRSEELHRFLAENTVDVISLLDAGLQRKYISPSCEKFYGYSQQDILGMKSPLDLVDPAYRVAVNQHLVEMFRSKKTTRYIYKALRKDGTVFWAEANINPLLDEETHEVKDLISVVRDISERMKHGEELAENARQKEYLLREIHNRVKNNFTILTSLMNMQRDESGDSELNRSLTDLQLRVRTMSLVHEQLYKNQEISTIPFDNYLQNLTMVISSAFNNNRIDLKTEIHPCQVDIEVALPLGLIINELITNAYKYAFPGNNTGTLWVRLLPDTEGKFTISIHDDGIGLPPDFSMQNTRSMGTQIVQILIQQVEAKLEVSNIKGASFRILFSPNQQ
ncbi:MAG: histidine kinase dimerization/phosphoacceptor domain -containing protein, partial [Bacteroidota bacterium]